MDNIGFRGSMLMAENATGRDGDKVLSILRDGIIRLEYRPGSVIDEAGLAARLKVSRTPIREAVIQLIADGLVIRDGRSARVAPLDFDDIPRIYDALLISSRMIHRLAAENRTEEDLSRIRAAMLEFEALQHRGDGLARQDANVSFHMQIALSANNIYFLEFYKRTLIASSRLSRACFSNTERGSVAEADPDDDLVAHVAETARQHRLMVEALGDRDVEASDRMATLHQDLSFNRLRKTMFRATEAISSAPSLSTDQVQFTLASTEKA